MSNAVWFGALATVVACANASPGGAASDAAPTDGSGDEDPAGRQPALSIRVRAVPVADDDGGKPVEITGEQVDRWVDEANKIYRAAGIRFEFDAAADLTEVRNSSTLNAIGASPAGAQITTGNAVASEFPGELVVVFRNGPDAAPITTGFASSKLDFMVMPGFASARVCGHQDLTRFAHEVGHHLGLFHSFAREDADEVAAFTALQNAAGNIGTFEGDGITDNGVDPYIASHQCDTTTEVNLGGEVLTYPRTDVMGFWDTTETKGLTDQQIDVVRQVLVARKGRGLGTLVDGSITTFEAEALASTGEPAPDAQAMAPFFGKWSGGSQLFWLGGMGAQLELTIPPDAGAGPKRLFGFFTVADDYGRVEVSLNGTVAIPDLDLYGAQVQHRGPIDLGTWNGATATLRLRVIGKNERSGDFKAGVDAFVVTAP